MDILKVLHAQHEHTHKRSGICVSIESKEENPSNEYLFASYSKHVAVLYP